MDRIETEILIIGGGIAGLTAAAAFANAGFETLCVDAQPAAGKSDGRSTALLMPAVALLQRAGLWARLAQNAAPLRVMRLIDADPQTRTIRETADFVSSEIGQPQFGFNLPNSLLRQEMLAHLATFDNARLFAPASFDRLTPRSTSALVRLADGRVISARLLIAADGRNSAVRTQIGIGQRTWRYGQRAVVFTVSHPLAHDGISTEIHHTGGPFTLVPLADNFHSAVVWMENSAKSTALLALPEHEFSDAASTRCCHVLGALTLTSTRAAWPIIAQIAQRLDGPRTALVAEAAHVVPPIGAQGLNMSLSDIALLLDLVIAARSAGQDIGSIDLLSRFSRTRMPVITARLLAIDALNRTAIASSPTLRDLRKSGLHALFNIDPLRRSAMKLGLG